MMSNMRILAIWAVLALVSTGIVLAEDGSPYISGHAGYLPPSIYVHDYIPYFSLHPPVYYSYPVPRPYGYSPYAYPPGTKTPEVFSEQPVIIQNKFVPRKGTAAPKRDRVAQAPLRIANPYVIGRSVLRGPEAEAVAADPGPQPQVVFPMANAGRR